MPTPGQIHEGLAAIANQWSGVAVLWHVAIAGLLAAVLFDRWPTRRSFALLLALPLASVSAFAWLAHNPFNGVLFATGACALAVIGARLPPDAPRRAPAPWVMLGFAMIAFGWVYPHFLETGAWLRYLYAAPTGLVPCPTLSVVVGFALLAGGLDSRVASLTLAALGLFYGLFGVFGLGVYLDAALIVGAAALATMGFRIATTRRPA